MPNKDVMSTNFEEDIMLTDDVEIDNDDGFEDELDSLLLEDEEEKDTASTQNKSFSEKDLHEAVRRAVIAERSKYKKQIAKIQSSNTTNSEFNEESFLENSMKKLMAKGYSEDDARNLAEYNLETQRELESIKLMLKNNDSSFKDHKKNIELQEMKNSSLYSDLDDEDVIESVVSLSEKKGLTLKQAYNALYADTKFNLSKSEIERQVEERIRNSGNLRNAMATNTNSIGRTQTKKIELSEDELEVAKLSGMTAKEFYLMKNVKTLDQYQKIKKK